MNKSWWDWGFFWVKCVVIYCKYAILRDVLMVWVGQVLTGMRRDGGGAGERVGRDLARQQAREIAFRAHCWSSVTRGNERLERLDRDQPPTADLDRAERSGL